MARPAAGRGPKGSILRLVFAATLALASAVLAHGGHAPIGTFPQWFSPAQAERGKALAVRQCAVCHGASLEGRFGPPLSGPRFLGKWGGKSAKELRAYIAARMPQGRPGTLSEAQTLDLVAFILQANGYPAGKADLKPGVLAHIELIKP